jgi:hypothetical protein
VNRRRQLTDRLERLSEEFPPKMHQVAEALRCFQATVPATNAFSEDAVAPVLSAEQREALADALLALCKTVRDTGFSRGIELILAKAQPNIGHNARVAIHLYSLGWTADREGILKLLIWLEKLPKNADNFDSNAPCQREVWRIVLDQFDVIMPWPFMRMAHNWHPVLMEVRRIWAELAGPPPQNQTIVNTPTDPVAVMREAILQARLILWKGSCLPGHAFDWQGVVNDLWKTWQTQLPEKAPPRRPTGCVCYHGASDAVDAMQAALTDSPADGPRAANAGNRINGVRIYHKCNIQEDHSVAKQHVQAGGNINVGGDFIVADAITNSFNKVAESGTPDDVKKAIKALGQAITKMSEELPPEKQREAAQDFDIVATEAAKTPPRKGLLTAALDGLKATAGTAAKYGPQVVALIGSIHQLIAHW